MPSLPPRNSDTRRPQKRRKPAFLVGIESVVGTRHAGPPGSQVARIVKRPANRVIPKNKFTAAHKSALLQALQQNSWTTAREAYGWVWNHLGLRINYITVWRFLTSQGLFTSDTPRARRLAPRSSATEAK